MTRLLFAAAVLAAAASAQVPSPKFEVASIKRCAARVPQTALLDITPGRLTANCAPVSFLIETAYHKYANGQGNADWRMTVEGGPAWIRSEFYQVAAQAENPNENAATLGGAMLRDLLEDRLQLKLHSVMTEIPVYALMLGKDDTKLRSHEEHSCSPCAGLKFTRSGQRTILTAEGVSLDELYKLQAAAVNRPVVNRTGIAGSYTFRLEYGLEPAQGVGQNTEPVGPSIFDVLEQQLGLKLVEAKGPAERLIIDSIARPSDN